MGESLTRNTDLLRAEVAAHVAADQVVQGRYWDSSKGCFIGCLAHSDDPRIAEEKYGLPIMVQRIAEAIFERLPVDEAPAFFAALPDAVQCDGKDLSHVGWQFLAADAAWAAWAAGVAAWAPAEAADAAGVAATRRQRDLLLRLISEAEVHHD